MTAMATKPLSVVFATPVPEVKEGLENLAARLEKMLEKSMGHMNTVQRFMWHEIMDTLETINNGSHGDGWTIGYLYAYLSRRARMNMKSMLDGGMGPEQRLEMRAKAFAAWNVAAALEDFGRYGSAADLVTIDG